MRPSRAIVRVKGKRREISGTRSLAREFGCADVRHCRLVIGTRSVCALQSLINGDALERLVGRLVRQFEFLPGSQTDHARYGQLLDGEVVLCLNQLLLPGLELYLGAQAVDVRRSARSHLVRCLIVERLRRIDLRLRRFDAGLVGDGLQIGIADGEHNEIARVFVGIFGGFQALAGRARGVDRFPVKQRLRHSRTCIEIRKRANGRWDADSSEDS